METLFLPCATYFFVGTGILALSLIRNCGASRVIGLDIESSNIDCANFNAKQSEVEETQLHFFEADSFAPHCGDGKAVMGDILNGTANKVDFLVANPPADSGTPLERDGFEYVGPQDSLYV